MLHTPSCIPECLGHKGYKWSAVLLSKPFSAIQQTLVYFSILSKRKSQGDYKIAHILLSEKYTHGIILNLQLALFRGYMLYL